MEFLRFSCTALSLRVPPRIRQRNEKMNGRFLDGARIVELLTWSPFFFLFNEGFSRRHGNLNVVCCALLFRFVFVCFVLFFSARPLPARFSIMGASKMSVVFVLPELCWVVAEGTFNCA